MARNELTLKQKRFVAEYLIDLNATQAAIRAGYSSKNADKIGSELLGKTRVAEAIQKALARRAAKVEVTQERVVEELARVAFGDLRGVSTWGPDGVSLKPSDELTDEQSAAISEVVETVTKDGGSVRIKRHDKVKALELLGRHLGMFVDKLDHTSSDGSMSPTPVIDLSHLSADELTGLARTVLKSETE